MSIFEEMGGFQRFVSPAERLDRFADRRDLVMLFLEKLQARGLASQILFVHGMGGSGKSELLRYLQDAAVFGWTQSTGIGCALCRSISRSRRCRGTPTECQSRTR